MMTVELIPTPTEITSDSLKQYLADCASVVRNAQPKDNNRLFDRLLKEGYGDTPSRMFEFIPCTIGLGEFMLAVNQLDQHFGFFNEKDEAYYTSARELLSAEVSWNDVLRVVDFTHYRAVRVKAPYFLYGQASTHTQVTSVSHSNRYTEAGLGYWMPEEVKAYWKERGETYGVEYTADGIQAHWNSIVEAYSPKQLQQYMRDKGVTRREVYARGSDMLAYRVFTLGGYLNSPNSWPHFINQRWHDLHTQKEMRQLAQLITVEVSQCLYI
jgi:hypothetical protein